MNKDNSGALFKETDKKSDKHPDYKGNCLVNGQRMYVSAWINESKKGEKYMGLSFSPPSEDAKYDKAASTTPAAVFEDATATQQPQTEDDLPF